MNDPHDQLLEAFLAEAIRDERPPDVVDPVLAAWRKNSASTLASSTLATRSTARPARRQYSWALSLAGVIVLGISLGLVLLGLEAWQRHRSAARSLPNSSRGEPDLVRKSTPVIPPRSDSIERTGGEPETVDRPRSAVAGHQPPSSNSTTRAPATPNLPAAARVAEPENLAGLVAEIDGALDRVWSESGIDPAERLARYAWAQRVVTTLLPDDETERENAIALLMAGTPTAALERFLQTYGRQGTQVLGQRIAGRLLQGRQTTQAAEFARLTAYVAQALQQRVPWNSMVENLLNPWGADSQNAGAESPVHADSFLTALAASYGPGSPRLADHVGRTFLHSSLGCAQCHDSSTGNQGLLVRLEFWQFQAYFSQLKLGIDAGQARLAKQDFFPEGRPNDSDAPLFFEESDGRLVAAYPAFRGVAEDSNSGLLSEFDRLDQIAQRIATSTECAEAGVDWIWESLLGYPLVAHASAWPQPVGEAFVPLRRRLADDLVQYQDAGVVLRAILLSDAFWRGEQAAPSNDQPQFGTLAYFSRQYPRVQRERSVGDRLATINNEYRSGAGSLGTFARISNPADNPVIEPGDRPDPAMDLQPAIVESLPQSTRDWGVPPRLAELLQQVAAAKIDDAEKIRHFFRIGLGRDPSPPEAEQARTILVLSQGSMAGFQDLWSSILLSNEIWSR